MPFVSPTEIIFVHHRPRPFGCTEDDASWLPDAFAFLTAASISTFSLLTGIAFDSKAGSGMCLPLRVLTLQHKDAVRYI
jgi:hypothetical protein